MEQGRQGSRLRTGCFGVLLASLTGCAGQRGPPPSAEIDENGFREAIRVLAGDDFEGRRPGTTGEEKTVAYLVAQFRKLGLKPGNGESFLQQVPLVEIDAQDDVALSIAGRGPAESLRYGKDAVIWTKREVTEASLVHSPVIFVGYGIVAPEYGWNDYAGTDVRGKTVLAMANDPGLAAHDPKLFKGNASTSYGRPAYKFEEAARQGAAGVLLLHDSGTADAGWNAVVNAGTRPQLAPATPDGNSRRAAIEGWVSASSGRSLFKRAGVDFDALSAAAAQPGFKAVTLAIEVNADLHNTVRRFNSPNVIGVLPGARRKHEYVIYTAHWDHLGRQSARAGGAIFNGAIANASGVAGLLMLAQSFSRTQPPADRSIAFMAFTAGEAGLLGSAYYIDNPLLPLRDSVAALNLDALHIGGPTRDVTIFGAGNSELDEYVRDAAQLHGREVRPDPNPRQAWYYRSDQLSFALAGVPALYAKGGYDDAARGPAWGQAQLADYMTQRYQQPADKYSPDWDVRGALDDLRLYFEVGNRLAHSRRFPRWSPASEFSVSHGERREAPVQ